jgi:tetratricopeptide (TPR) repeat protein
MKKSYCDDINTIEWRSAEMKTAEEIYQKIKTVPNDNNYKVKIEKLEELLQKNPDFVLAHDELGAIFYQIEDYKKALKHFERAVCLEPNNIKYQKNLGDFYYTILSRSEDALDCYRKVLGIDPMNSEVSLVTANLLVSLHRLEEAEELYKKILSLEPWRLDVQELIEKIEKKRKGKNFETTEERYQEAQRLAQVNDRKKAIEILEKILTDDPEYAMAHNDIGVLRYQMGEIEDAQGHYEKAVEIDSENMVFKKNLAEYYLFVKGEILKALEIYLSILKDHPYDIETLLAAAKISEKFERIEDAKVFYEAILDIEPWNLEASEKLTQI